MSYDYYEQPQTRYRPARPLGVSILAVLHAISSPFVFVAMLLLTGHVGETREGLEIAGASPAALVMGVYLIVCVGAVSGFGMWLGAQWGWWCATFLYVFGIFRNISMLVAMATSLDAIPAGAIDFEYQVFKYVVRSLLSVLLILYLLKDNVLEFFDLYDLQKGAAIRRLISISGAVTLLFMALYAVTR